MRTVRRGDRGPDVAAWQRVLAASEKPGTWTNVRGERGTWSESQPWPLAEDGIFGALTERATEAWQATRGLEADGVVGPRTWQAAGVVSLITEPEPLIRGSDLSAIQGILDAQVWSALRDLGIRFAIHRAIVGNESWSDKAFRENDRRAEEFGIVGGRYLFGFPLRHIDPRVQVDEWIARLERAGDDLGTLPLALDLEWPPREEWKTIDGARVLTFPWRDKWKIDGSFVRAWGVAAVDQLRKRTGRWPIFYSFRYFLQCIEAGLAPELAACPLWLADYTHKGRFPSAAEVARLRVPGPWSEIAIVQHDGDGGLMLPNGRDADFNVMTGGEARLRALCGGKEAALAAASTLPPIDLARARLAAAGELVDAAVAAYRRDRINEALAAA